MPDVERPDKNEDGDEIWLEFSVHDGDHLDLVYENRVPVHWTGPGSVEDIEYSRSLARTHLERCGKLSFRGQK